MTDPRIMDLVAAHDEVELAEMYLRLQEQAKRLEVKLEAHHRHLQTARSVTATHPCAICTAAFIALAEVER